MATRIVIQMIHIRVGITGGSVILLRFLSLLCPRAGTFCRVGKDGWVEPVPRRERMRGDGFACWSRELRVTKSNGRRSALDA